MRTGPPASYGLWRETFATSWVQTLRIYRPFSDTQITARCNRLGGITSIDGINKLAELQKDTRMLSESGFYLLIFRSRKPEAVRFQKWICREVLLSIRKHGCYFTQPLIERILNDLDYGIELIQRFAADRKARESQNGLEQQFPLSETRGDGLIIDVTP